MDEEHFDALRRWGLGLLRDPREEIHAAGRAIVLLCAEVDRLERELWNEKTRCVEEPASLPFDASEPIEEPLGDTLGSRARRSVRSLYTRRLTS